MTVLRDVSAREPDDLFTDVVVTRPSIDDLAPMLRGVVGALDAVAEDIARPGLPSEAVLLAEAVTTARLTLYTELIRQGWVAPDQVPAGVKVDKRLVAEALGSCYDHD